MSEQALKLLSILLEMLADLEPGNEEKLDKLKRRGIMFLEKLYGSDSDQVSEFRAIYFRPMFMGPTPAEERKAWDDAAMKTRNLLETYKESEELIVQDRRDHATPTEAQPVSPTDIFVVHGHDDEMREAVARKLEKLGFNPVILHEQANMGRTIIEKFSDHSDVGFAVVLLSPDDKVVSDDAGNTKYRARQNVVFELGFFIGKLSRARVVVLFRTHDDFEMLSDYSGVLYTAYEGKNWAFELATELKAAGYDVDLNKLA